MSPIDIVPKDHHPFLGRYINETAMSSDIIENRGVYSSGDISREESLLSVKPLISHQKPQPRTGRTVVSIFLHLTIKRTISLIYYWEYTLIICSCIDLVY